MTGNTPYWNAVGKKRYNQTMEEADWTSWWKATWCEEQPQEGKTSVIFNSVSKTMRRSKRKERGSTSSSFSSHRELKKRVDERRRRGNKLAQGRNEWFSSNRRLSYAHRNMGSPRGKHSKSLQRNVRRGVVSPLKAVSLDIKSRILQWFYEKRRWIILLLWNCKFLWDQCDEFYR